MLYRIRGTKIRTVLCLLTFTFRVFGCTWSRRKRKNLFATCDCGVRRPTSDVRGRVLFNYLKMGMRLPAKELTCCLFFTKQRFVYAKLYFISVCVVYESAFNCLVYFKIIIKSVIYCVVFLRFFFRSLQCFFGVVKIENLIYYLYCKQLKC